MAKNDHAEIDQQEETPVDEVETTAESTKADSSNPDGLEKAQALADEYKEALQRERADFQNYKRRVERERETLRPTLSADILRRFLPIVDDFERALGAVPEQERSTDWISGITQIHRKFLSVLESEGIAIIDPLGEKFDPNFHEAIGADDPTDEIGSDHVIAVLQKGYRQGDRVLRPAIVRVAS